MREKLFKIQIIGNNIAMILEVIIYQIKRDYISHKIGNNFVVQTESI